MQRSFQSPPPASPTSATNPTLITPKLAALHDYQLGLPAPKPPPGSFDPAAAQRGEKIFDGVGRCAACHVPPLFTEPGENLHRPAEICTDSFQADRSPTGMYRTTPAEGALRPRQGRLLARRTLPRSGGGRRSLQQLLRPRALRAGGGGPRGVPQEPLAGFGGRPLDGTDCFSPNLA